MAEASTNTKKIDLLTGKNYCVWALKVGVILRGKKLFREVI